jgi:hypothetical protein
VTAVAPPAPKRTNPAPIIVGVVAGVLLLVLMGVAGVMFLRSANQDGPAPSPAAGPPDTAPESPPGIDECLLGLWQNDSLRFELTDTDGARHTFEGSGGQREFFVDGTAVFDLTGSVSSVFDGKNYIRSYSGEVLTRYTADGATIHYSGWSGSLTEHDTHGGVTTQTLTQSAVLQDETYECSDELLTITEPPEGAAGEKTKVYHRVTV